MNFTDLEHLIKSGISDAQVQITDLTGTSDHLGITVISDQFANKRPLEQHRMVMDILRPKFKDEIHAVQLKTLTQEKAQKQGLL